MSTELTSPLESATRIKINNWLVNLGWNLDENNPKCNCFTERARTVEENQKFKGQKPDYVLYSSETLKPIAVIEAKRPGVSLEKALEQGVIKYAEPLNVKIVFVTDGLFIQAYHLNDKDFLYYNSELVTEFLPEKRLQLFIEGGSKIFSEKKVTHSKVELIKIFEEANDILRKDGLSEGRERFTEFSNLLFLKLISDIEKHREEIGEQRKLERMYCWDEYKDKFANELYEYINKIVLPRFEKEYNHTSDIFNKKLLINKPENLQAIIAKISKIGNLLDTNSDIKGDAFEYFLKNSISVGNDLGEYFTPRHIVKLIVELLDLKFEETIYDPCCGTGGFLIEAFKNIRNKCKNTPNNIDILENNTVFGREISTTSRIAKMNMIIMGDGHNNIEQKDSLEYPIKEKYDVVLTNFAFSQKTDYGSYYGFDTTDANPVFVKHIYDSMKKDGRCAVVVPEGLLFDTKKEYVRIRKLLVEQANVVAVIRLHSFVFKPYTGQPTSILIFEKGSKTKKVWLFDVQEDGFKQTGSKKGRRKIQADDLILLRQSWKEKSDTEKSFSVDVKDIISNNYQLSLSNHLKKQTQGKTIKLKKLVKNGKIIIGFTPDRNDDAYWFGGKNIWVKVGDITDEMFIDNSSEKITDLGVKPAKLLPKDTLLFSFKLSIGKVAIAKVPLYTNEAIAGLIIEDETIRKYLYYILPTLDYETNRATKGETLNKDSVGNIEIPFDKEKIPALVEKLDKIEQERQEHIRIKDDLRKQQFELIKTT
ncbi:MAG: N-6 DNA methylase [Prevotellaceae bacterium]|jgi:type I restriction enzyme M protein|nr:N-6 DNA methylase [Prevotellaceae bacterium]